MEKKEKKISSNKLPKYEPPRVEEYDEEALLKNVAVLGCYPFPP